MKEIFGKQNMISIVIPLYNKERQIRNTLNSISEQTFQDFEIVIVNDGSTDKSVDVVNDFSCLKIRLINQENQGVSAARNRGIEEAKYNYIALLDADDEWKPDYLQTQIGLIKKYPQCSVYACAYEFRMLNGNVYPVILNKLPFRETDGVLVNYFEVASCSNPPIWSSAVVLRREAVKNVGGFPVGVKSGEDILTWAKLAAKYSIAFSVKVLATFVEAQGPSGKLQERMTNQEFVSLTLEKMYEDISDEQKADFKSYLIRWYKIMATLQIETANTQGARQTLRKAMNLGASSWDLILQRILSFFPGKIARNIFNCLRKIR